MKLIKRRTKQKPATFYKEYLNELRVCMLAKSTYVVKTYGGFFFDDADGDRYGLIVQKRMTTNPVSRLAGVHSR